MSLENSNANLSDVELESVESISMEIPTDQQYASEPISEDLENFENAGEEMLNKMEIADTRLDIEGMSRHGEAWDKAKDWAKKGWTWAKEPSKTYPEAIGKAALFSAGTTVFLAPVYLFLNCRKVYQSRKNEQLNNFAHA